MTQNVSAQQPSTAPLPSFGDDCGSPADVLENVKAVVTFLNVAVCNALSGRSGHLTPEGVLGVTVIFGATLASLEAVLRALKTNSGE